MQYKSLSIISASLVLLGASTATVAAQRTNVKEIEPYVGAQRLPESLPQMEMLPDGNSYAAITADGKKIVKYDLATGKETETMLDLGNTRENKIDRIETFTISTNGAYTCGMRSRAYISPKHYSRILPLRDSQPTASPALRQT